MKWAAVTTEDSIDDAEAFGPFTSSSAAQRFVEEYDAAEVRPAYPLVVIELLPVREGLRQIRESREQL